MKSIIAAALLAVSATAACADNLDAYSADFGGPTPVVNVCSFEFKSVSQLAACWDANGSSSKQFGSEGGSDSGDSGEGSDGGSK